MFTPICSASKNVANLSKKLSDATTKSMKSSQPAFTRSRSTMETPKPVGSVHNVVLLSLWSTMIRVHILVWYFHFLLRTSKSWLVLDVAYLTWFFSIPFNHKSKFRTVPGFSCNLQQPPDSYYINWEFSLLSPVTYLIQVFWAKSVCPTISVSIILFFNGKISSKNNRICNISYPWLLHFLNMFVHIFSRLENITCL